MTTADPASFAGLLRLVRRGAFFAALLCAAIAGVGIATTSEALARYAAIVVDAESGKVLYSRNADRRRYPASLTKMMTLYLTFEALESGKLKLETRLKISRRAAGQTPSKLGLKRGRRISVEDAILAVAVKSANDAATVLAEALGESEVDFALRMTRKAKLLGMKRTRFRNASGLPNRRQRTTARDMATLSLRLIKDFPKYYHYFSEREFVWGKRRHRSHNRLLGKYKGMDGLKTGYIRASGFNIATSAVRKGRRLIGVVMGGRTSKSRDRHIARLLNMSFNRAATLNAFVARAKPKPKPAPKAKRSIVAAVLELAQDRGKRRGEKVAKRGDPTIVIPPAKPTKPKTGPRKTDKSKNVLVAPTDGVKRPAPADGKSWWGIQVGAYKRYATAQRRVHQAAGALPDMLMHARPSIDRMPTKKGRSIYRARLVGLREIDARKACRVLKRKSFACIPISPSGNSVLELASR